MATDRIRSDRAAPNWSRLRTAPDYRAFLKAYLEERSMSLSDLARAAGFGRGFPGDIISGKRRLTHRSYHAFEKALKVPAMGRKLFHHLVALEEPDLFPGLERSRVEHAIEALRSASWERSRRKVMETDASPALIKLLQRRSTGAVYAALGSPETGASLSLIAARTGMPENEAEEILRDFQDTGLARRENGTYFPDSFHLFFKSIGKSATVKAAFQSACRAASERAPEALDSESEFFFSSSFCVKKDRLPELKAALRKTVLEFVDHAIDTDGDDVAHLVSSLYT